MPKVDYTKDEEECTVVVDLTQSKHTADDSGSLKERAYRTELLYVLGAENRMETMEIELTTAARGQDMRALGSYFGFTLCELDFIETKRDDAWNTFIKQYTDIALAKRKGHHLPSLTDLIAGLNKINHGILADEVSQWRLKRELRSMSDNQIHKIAVYVNINMALYRELVQLFVPGVETTQKLDYWVMTNNTGYHGIAWNIIKTWCQREKATVEMLAAYVAELGFRGDADSIMAAIKQS